MVEQIIPSELEADELWKRNGEYVSALDYDAAVARLAELEAVARRTVDWWRSEGMHKFDGAPECMFALVRVSGHEAGRSPPEKS